jgi:hypothetical protein
MFNQVRESSDAGPFNSWCAPAGRPACLLACLSLPHSLSTADGCLSVRPAQGPHDISDGRSQRHAVGLESLGRDRGEPDLQQLPGDDDTIL